MVEEKIKTIDDFFYLVENSSKHFNQKLWWRGQGNCKWHLLPQIFRQEKNGKYFLNPNESNMTLTFKSMAKTRHQFCPDDDKKLLWLFLMQHYELPTRLLDWSTSPLAALYFAINGRDTKEENGALWGLDPFLFNNLQGDGKQIGILTPDDSSYQSIIDIPFGKHPKTSEEFKVVDKYWALIVDEFDIRHLVQQSKFTLHGQSETQESTPLDELELEKDFFVKFVIPSERKERLKRDLELLGIHEAMLFPDLEHLASYVKLIKFKP